ncbi:hypothetical protein B566_EDAN004528 [Ephemera danica]|nr:hypothetical protein B566_EDAN004528 [Ephemera danica]
MTLLRFETEAERQCLQEKNTLFNYDYMTWSNGIKDGSWTWCPDYNAIPAEELHWLAGEPSNLGGNEFCLQYALRVGPVANNVSKFRDIPCSTISLFICEYLNKILCDICNFFNDRFIHIDFGIYAIDQGEATTTAAPTPAPCPVIKCTTDPTLFDSSGKIKRRGDNDSSSDTSALSSHKVHYGSHIIRRQWKYKDSNDLWTVGVRMWQRLSIQFCNENPSRCSDVLLFDRHDVVEVRDRG